MSRHVLFLCTANSARSVLAESLLNSSAAGRFVGHSAGSRPRGQVHEMVLAILRDHGHDTGGLRSKSWDEFAGADAPAIDFVFTVCDNAAGETCPIWPGHPMTAHWGIPDPAAVEGDESKLRKAFELAYQRLNVRIAQFLSLPFEELDDVTLRERLRAIGREVSA